MAIEQKQYSSRPTKSYAICIGICLFLINMLALWQSNPDPYLNCDELELAASSIDRWLGIPQTSLAWPGSITQIIYVFGAAMAFGLSAIMNFSEFIKTFGSGLYDDIYSLMWVNRTISVASISIGLAFVFKELSERLSQILIPALIVAMASLSIGMFRLSVT